MKIQVLEEAVADLAEGFRFHERQTEGLGNYFLERLLWTWSKKSRERNTDLGRQVTVIQEYGLILASFTSVPLPKPPSDMEISCPTRQ